MYLAKISVRRMDGTRRYYYVLRETKWSKSERRPIQHYIAYIGPQPVLTLEKARKLSEKLGIELDELARVRHLQITGCDIANQISEKTPFGTVSKT